MRFSALLLPVLLALAACPPAARSPANPPDTTIVDTVAPGALMAPAMAVRIRTVYDTVFLPAPLPAGTDTVKVSTDTTRYIRWHTGRINDSSWIVVRPVPTALGVPFGTYWLWASSTTLKASAAPFTASIQASDPGTVVAQITAARSMGQHLLLFFAGGSHTPYMTNGVFDLAKWKARVALFNTAAIKTAVAQGVADGTILGNALIDEPENVSWGPSGSLTKPKLDQMATYAKTIFPTLPMGVQAMTTYAGWRTGERYAVVDYVWVPPMVRSIGGNLTAWRDAVVARAVLDGVAVMWGLNVLDGGVQAARDGLWICSATLTQGRGTYDPNCRMTSAQVRDWSLTLAQRPGCAQILWTYDAAYLSRADNQQALRDVATMLATLPRKACRRP